MNNFDNVAPMQFILTTTGRCLTANISVQGLGDANCKGLVAHETTAKLLGSGDIRILG